MKNRLLIIMTQQLPAFVRGRFRELRSVTRLTNVSNPPAIAGIECHLSQGFSAKRALVLFRPDIWLEARKQHPDIKLYNSHGFIWSIVKALNESGFIVDLVDPKSNHGLSESYEFCIGHGGYCARFLDLLPVTVPVFAYISGSQADEFNLESDARYERFYRSCGKPNPKVYRRSVIAHMEGQASLENRASVLFSIHCPRMAESYGENSKKFRFTGLGAYLDRFLDIPSNLKNFESGKRNFIYVGGSGGNLQKGLDLLIEAFHKTPELNLYIYCKVEEEILDYCRKELASPNIHYIYHWRFKGFHSRLRNLLKITNFSLHAPINTGLGTAFSATMGIGLIPVGYVDLAHPGEAAVLTDSWQVDSLVGCIMQASQKSAEWCNKASELARRYYMHHCDPDTVEREFRKLFTAVYSQKSL